MRLLALLPLPPHLRRLVPLLPLAVALGASWWALATQLSRAVNITADALDLLRQVRTWGT